MSFASQSMSARRRSQEHMQTLVSVEKAIQLQNLSMKRFQAESAVGLKLGRMIGHISVNQRSTEIIKTATFMDDILEELEREDEDMAYDEDAIAYNISFEQTIPTTKTQETQPRTEIFSPLRQHPTQQAIATSPTPAAIANPAERYQPLFSDMATICAENEFLTQIDEDWMYDVLNLHIDLESIRQPVPSSQLPPSIVIQFWRHILASLSEFAKSRPPHHSPSFDMDQVEAYGVDSLPMGFGLQRDHQGPSQSQNFELGLRLIM